MTDCIERLREEVVHPRVLPWTHVHFLPKAKCSVMGEGAACAWELEVQRGLTHCSEHSLTEILWPEPQTKCPISMKMPLEGASSGLWRENQILLCSCWQKISKKHNQVYYYYYELLLRRPYTRKVQQSPEVKSMASGESGQCLNPARHLLVVWPGASYMTSLALVSLSVKHRSQLYLPHVFWQRLLM